MAQQSGRLRGAERGTKQTERQPQVDPAREALTDLHPRLRRSLDSTRRAEALAQALESSERGRSGSSRLAAALAEQVRVFRSRHFEASDVLDGMPTPRQHGRG